VPAAGHDVAGRRQWLIGGTFAWWCCTACTGTAEPACADEAAPPPAITRTRDRHPDTSTTTDTSTANTRRGRRKALIMRENIIYLRQVM
jgi:hypothetical protein